MNADNFIAIVRGNDGLYSGYDCFASSSYNKLEDYMENIKRKNYTLKMTLMIRESVVV